MLFKVSPLADWSSRDVWSYLKQYNIPVLPLYDHGYTSIGCEPCTSLPLDPDNPRFAANLASMLARTGRWEEAADMGPILAAFRTSAMPHTAYDFLTCTRDRHVSDVAMVGTSTS